MASGSKSSAKQKTSRSSDAARSSGNKTARPSTHSRKSVGPEVAATQAEQILNQTHGSGRMSDLPVKSEPFAYRPISELVQQASDPLPPPPQLPQEVLMHNLAGLLNPSDPNAMALLGLCSMIDSGELSSAEENPAVAAAIQHYLAQILPTQQAAQQPGPSTSHQEAPSQDDEVVFLDKENVNPTVFRRRAEREREEAKLLAVSGSSSTLAESSPPRIGLSVRSNTVNDILLPTSSMNESTAGRKRSLSDAEGSKRDRQRKVSSSKDLPPASHRPIPDPYRHYSRIAEPAAPGSSSVAKSSPPRPSRDENMQYGSSHGRPIVIPDSPLRVAASSPVRVKRKPYVVPEWARTATATKPRLSDEAHRALKEAQQRKEQERKAKRVRLSKHKNSSVSLPTPPSSQSSIAPSSQGSSSLLSSGSSQPPTNLSSSQGSSFTTASNLPAPIAASGDLPIFAASFSSSIPSSPPRSPSPSRATSSLPFLPKTPKTPSRRSRTDNDSPDATDGSLFTPLAKTPSVRTLHPLLSPFLKSPCGRPSHSSPSAYRKGTADQETGDDLTSTLPMASSDAEDNEESDIPEQGAHRNSMSKQYWQGLPPSSPPPPSSPASSSPGLLLPNEPGEEDQAEDDQLPIISSDVEEDIAGLDETVDQFTSETGTAELDVFDLWMNNIQSDDVLAAINDTDLGLDMDSGGTGEELNFEEFLTGFIPLLGGQTSNVTESSNQLGEYNPKPQETAQEMQMLLSGCVL